MVPKVGVEPTLPKEPDLKSGASAIGLLVLRSRPADSDRHCAVFETALSTVGVRRVVPPGGLGPPSLALRGRWVTLTPRGQGDRGGIRTPISSFCRREASRSRRGHKKSGTIFEFQVPPAGFEPAPSLLQSDASTRLASAAWGD